MFGQHANVLLSPAEERRVIRVRRHWAVLLAVVLQTVGVVIGALILSWWVSGFGDLWLVQSLLWYLAVGAVLRFAWRALEWWMEVIIVTNKRFMINSGIIVTKNSMMPKGKVTDISFMRPFLGQLLGYGSIRVESAGQKQDLELIAYLPYPDEVFMAISELVFGSEKPLRSRTLEPPRGPRRRLWALARWANPGSRLR